MDREKDSTEQSRTPSLRVVFGEDEINLSPEIDRQPVDRGQHASAEDVEAYWIGHTPATRHSARMSA